MAQKHIPEGTDRIISFVLSATEQLLAQMDLVVDNYRALFFSGGNPKEIAERLGEMSTEFLKLADIGVALSTVQEGVDSYSQLLDRLVGLSNSAAHTSANGTGLRVVPDNNTEGDTPDYPF